MLFGKAVEKRAEADSLYDPLYVNMDTLTQMSFSDAVAHDCAFLICSEMKADSSCMPSFVRLLTLKSGAPGLTVS